jgi:hypothetical protein
MPHCTTKRTSCSLGTHDSSKILSGECKIITPCPQWCDGVRNTLFGDSYIVEVLSEGKSLTRNKTNTDGGITTQVKVPFQYNVGVGEGVFVNTHGSIANCAVGFNALQGIYGCENIALGFEAGICSGTSYCDLLTSNPSESWQSTGVCLLGAKTCNKEVTSWGDTDVVTAVTAGDACFGTSEGNVDSTDSGMWNKLNFSVALGAGATTANHYECVIGGDIEASFETELIPLTTAAPVHIKMTQKAENPKSNGIRCLKGGQKTSKLRNEIDTSKDSPNWTTAGALQALEDYFIYNPDKTDPCDKQTNKIPVFSVATEQHPLSQINMLTLFPSINTQGKTTNDIIMGQWSKEDLNFNSFPTTIGADGKRCIACIPILNGIGDGIATVNTITWTECLARGIPLKVGDLYARPNGPNGSTGDFQLCVCMPAAMP